MSNSQPIHWKRISVEAVVIVSSILLAFAIDAWWAERQERIFEQETLTGLLSEFQGHKEVLNVQRRGVKFMSDATGSLLRYAQTGTFEFDGISIDRAMSYMRLPMTTDLGSGIRDALISSGRIEILSDKRLRFELAEWSSVLDELKDDQQNGVNVIINLVYPYLTRQGVPITSFIGIFPDSPVRDGSRTLAADPEARKRLFTDPEFLSILELRFGMLKHTIKEYDTLIAATDSILARVEASSGN